MTRSIVLASLLLVLPAGAAQAAPTVNANWRDQAARSVDLGCAIGLSQKDKFPKETFDPASRERIKYNISACTGGYILGVNVDTGRAWNADIAYNGRMSGKDAAGHRWSYDPVARLYTNLATGRTCATTSLRQVCGD